MACAARPGAEASSFLIFFDRMLTYCSCSSCMIGQDMLVCIEQLQGQRKVRYLAAVAFDESILLETRGQLQELGHGTRCQL